MNRREFLQITAALAAGMAVDGCSPTTSRYLRPSRLTTEDEKLLLRNATVIDVKSGAVLERRQILIKDKKIVSIFPEGQNKNVVPDRELDLKNQYVIPGLINAHCHMTLPGGFSFDVSFLSALDRQIERNAEECIKHGVTTVRDLFAAMNNMTKLKDKIRSRAIVGPRIITCCALQVDGGYLRQLGWFTRNRWWMDVNNPKQAVRAVKKAVDMGADFIKIFQQPVEMYVPGNKIPVMDLPTMGAICEEAAKHDRTVAMHHVTCEGLKKGLQAGVHSYEHMACDREINDEEMKLIAEKKPWFVPTISVAYSMCWEKKGDPNWGKGRIPTIVEKRKVLMPDMLKEYLEPQIYAGSFKNYQKFGDPKSFEKPPTLYWIDPAIPNAAAVIGDANITKLRKGNANFAAGNDGGVPYIFPGAMALEMYLLEHINFATKDILKLATIQNAKMLGVDDLIGSIDEGKFADLVVLEKNPLATMQHAFHPVMVFQNGQLVFRREGSGPAPA